MQSRVVEIDDEGPVRRNNNNEEEERKGGSVIYPERDPFDLIEEDKRPFARRKLLSTCCGGFRTVYDEVTAQPVHPGLLALQILIYLFFPVIVIVFAKVIMSEKDQRNTAGAAVAGTALVVCGIVHGISFNMKRNEMERAATREATSSAHNANLSRPGGLAALQKKREFQSVDADDQVEDDNSFCSKKSFYFLFPPRQTIAELVVVIALAPFYGFLVTYLCHPATVETVYPDDTAMQTRCFVLSIIVVFFSSYSLLSLPIPEHTPYGTDDSFSLFSHHYQRIIYQIIFSVVLINAEQGSKDGIALGLLVPGIYWANFIVLLLQMFGWLSNPFVTILYFLEQADILLFGGTARASDARIIISFAVNTLLVVIFTHTDISTDANLTIIYALLAFLTSKNYMHTVGLKKPFKIENEEMARQRTKADIVFRDLQTSPQAAIQKHNESQVCSIKTIIFNALNLAVVFTSVIVFQILFLAADDPTQIVLDWTKNVTGQDRRSFITTFSYIGSGLSLVIYIVSALSKRLLCRCIPSANLSLPSEITRVGTLLMQALSIGCATVIVLNQTQATWYVYAAEGSVSLLTVWENFSLGINAMLSFRAFKRALIAPMLFQLEIVVALTMASMIDYDSDFYSFWLNRYNILGFLVFSHFLIHRCRVLVNKITYLLVSFLTAFKNKKQRIRSQWICFTIQWTIGLPYFLGVLAWTTFFDVAMMPLFGFAVFHPSFLKPNRCWQTIQPVVPDPKGSVSDGHLFQAMQGQLNEQIREMLLKDPSNFEAGSFYLLKNEKMIILVQVLERADGFVVFTSKGAELQETTVCHAEENEHINEAMKRVFENKEIDPQFNFSLSPIRQVEFSLYSDLKYSLAGMITDQEFANMTKKYFLSILAYRLAKLFERNPQAQMVKVSESALNSEDLNRSSGLIDDHWLRHLNVANQQFVYHKMREEPRPRNVQQNAAATGGISFLDHINQTGANHESNGPLRGAIGNTGLNDNISPGLSSINRDVEGTIDVGRNRGGGMAEDQMFDDLENMLGSKNTGAPSVAKLSQPSLGRKGSHSKIMPLNDLDDLEDMYQFENKRVAAPVPKPTQVAARGRAATHVLNKGFQDDLDDELEDSNFNTNSLSKPPRAPQGLTIHGSHMPDAATNASPSRDISKISNQDGRVMSADTREPMQPTPIQAPRINPGSQLDDFGELDEELTRNELKTDNPNKAGALDDLADLEDLMEGGEEEDNSSGSIKQFLQEAYCLVFKDDYTVFESAMFNAFNATVQQTLDTKKFLHSEDIRAQYLKNEILYSVRLAMHISMDKFIMADFDIEKGDELAKLISSEYGQWFLGGEPMLWNMAIERRMPQLERMIVKKNQHYVHQLKYGKASDADSRFSVFEFRREVARAIWANLNSELIYWTNANDERFSIQAEKDILRNLLVHLAENPLGYPVYASGAQAIYY